MATVTVTGASPKSIKQVFTFDTWLEASDFAADYFTSLSYADGLETSIEVGK